MYCFLWSELNVGEFDLPKKVQILASDRLQRYTKQNFSDVYLKNAMVSVC